MPIPVLNTHGLLPAGRHPCTLREIESRFGWSQRRKVLCTGLKAFISEIRTHFSQPLYVDGSYVTDKQEPSDIDVVLDMRLTAEFEQFTAFKFMNENRARLMATYGIDFWVNLGTKDALDFCDFFEYLGTKGASSKGLTPSHVKGILQVV